MKRIHLSNSYSIDYIIKILMIILLPIVLLDSIISIYVIHSMRQQTINALQDTTTLYISQIDTEHTSINKYLMRRLTENTDVQTILETDDSLKLISSFEKARRDVDTFVESFENGYQIFFYNRKHNRMLRLTEVFDEMSLSDLTEVNTALISYMKNSSDFPSYSDAWEILDLKSGIYFFKIFHSGDNFAGCLFLLTILLIL